MSAHLPDSNATLPRCVWATTPLLIAYHDAERGVPLHDDRQLLEFLVLEGAQAGLSWATILARRSAYRAAFANFDAAIIAGYDAADVQRLMADRGIVRNHLKIRSAITNAQAYLDVQRELGSFATYIWSFIGGQPRMNSWRSAGDIPAETQESRLMSRDLRRRGFSFVGPTICYAFMQATGMVNDHLVDCYRYTELASRR